MFTNSVDHFLCFFNFCSAATGPIQTDFTIKRYRFQTEKNWLKWCPHTGRLLLFFSWRTRSPVECVRYQTDFVGDDWIRQTESIRLEGTRVEGSASAIADVLVAGTSRHPHQTLQLPTFRLLYFPSFQMVVFRRFSAAEIVEEERFISPV